MKNFLGIFKSVNNMSGHYGCTPKNQFIIHTSNGVIFQSYDSIIAAKINDVIYLDKNKWSYSKTTGKYRNLFLGENKKETEKKIKTGEYKLINLNQREIEIEKR